MVIADFSCFGLILSISKSGIVISINVNGSEKWLSIIMAIVEILLNLHIFAIMKKFQAI